MEIHPLTRSGAQAPLPVDARTGDGGTCDRGLVSLGLSIGKSIRVLVGLKLAPLGIVVGQDQLLTSLDTKAISVGTLAGLMSVRPSTASKMVDRLVERGLVERTSHASDQRRTLVRLTDRGLSLRAGILEVWDQVEKDLAASLAGTGRPGVLEGIASFDDALTRRLKRLR